MRTSRSFSSWSPWQRILKRPMTRLVDFFRSRWMAVDKNQTLRRQYLLFSRMVAVVAFVLNQRDSFASWLLCRSYCVPVRKACLSTHRYWIPVRSLPSHFKNLTFSDSGVMFYSFATSSTTSVLHGLALIYCAVCLLFAGLFCLLVSLFYINFDWNLDEPTPSLPDETQKVDEVKLSPILELPEDSISLCQHIGCRAASIYPPVKPYHKLYHPQDFRLQRTYLWTARLCAFSCCMDSAAFLRGMRKGWSLFLPW